MSFLIRFFQCVPHFFSLSSDIYSAYKMTYPLNKESVHTSHQSSTFVVFIYAKATLWLQGYILTLLFLSKLLHQFKYTESDFQSLPPVWQDLLK